MVRVCTCSPLTLHRASPSTQRSIRVYMTVTGRHTTHIRMSEHDRLAIRMLVTLRSSCCRAMMNTRPALPSNPIAMIVLYATIQKVAPPTEGGHLEVSAQSEASQIFRGLLMLDMLGRGDGREGVMRGRDNVSGVRARKKQNPGAASELLFPKINPNQSR